MTSETPAEKAKRLKVPLLGPTPSRPIFDPDPTISVCGTCGLELKRIMGYVCSQNDCPTGLGSPTSMAFQ